MAGCTENSIACMSEKSVLGSLSLGLVSNIKLLTQLVACHGHSVYHVRFSVLF